MKKSVSVLAQAAIATVISALVSEGLISSAQAATVTYDFKVDITEGVLIGNQYQGLFSYDDEAINGTLLPFFSPFEFSFDFVETFYQNRFEPRNYANFVTDCRVDYPRCLPLEIVGGEVRNNVLLPKGGELVSFNLTNLFPRYTDPRATGFYRITNLGFEYLIGADVDNYEEPFFGKGTVILMKRSPTTSVPESSALLGLLGLGFVGVSSVLKRQKQAYKKVVNCTSKSDIKIMSCE